MLFLLTGGTAAVVNFTSRIAYSYYFNFSTAIILAYCTGMVVAFVLAKLFVFASTKNNPIQSAAIFIFINLVGAMQTWLIAITLAFHLLPVLGLKWHTEEVAHLIGVLFPVFTSYLGHKYWSFR